MLEHVRSTARTNSIDAAVSWATLLAVLASALALGGNRPQVWITLAALVGGLFAAHWIVDRWRANEEREARGLAAPFSLYLLVLGWAWLQAIPGWAPSAWLHPAWQAVDARGTIAVDPAAAHHHVVRLAAYAAVFAIALRAGTRRRRAHSMVRLVALFSSAVAIYGLIAAAVAANAVTAVVGGGAGPLTATFVNRNAYATYAALGMLANLAAWMFTMAPPIAGPHASTRQIWRARLDGFFGGGWIFAAGALLCAVAVLGSQSRGGAMAAVVGAVAFVLLVFRRGDRRWPFLLTAVLTGSTFIAATSADEVARRVLATDTDQARWSIYAATLYALGERPWLGHGLGGFADGFRARVPPDVEPVEWDLAHNTYLENLFELGIPMGCAFFAAVGGVLWRLWQRTRSFGGDRIVASLALAGLLVAMLHALVDFSPQMPATAALLAFLTGLGCGRRHSGPSIPAQLRTRRMH
jgi:O-antigen ligase